jgi:hypothetical protein
MRERMSASFDSSSARASVGSAPGMGGAPQIGHHALQHAVAAQLVTAGWAGRHVPLHTLRRGSPGFTGRYRHEVARNFTAGRDVAHGYRSVWTTSRSSSPWRIFRKA